MACLPEILLEFYDHQECHPVSLQFIQTATQAALPLIFGAPGPETSHLVDGLTVEFTFVDDATITKIHADFLQDPTATDVITFHHGEVIISTDTAHRQAAEHHQPLHRELTLYAIHGLLHLHGHEDHTEFGAALMKRLQEQILQQVFPE